MDIEYMDRSLLAGRMEGCSSYIIGPAGAQDGAEHGETTRAFCESLGPAAKNIPRLSMDFGSAHSGPAAANIGSLLKPR